MLHIVLLAGGRSQRMQSSLPKVLHPVGGKPLLAHLIESALQLKPDVLSVVYHDERVPEQLDCPTVDWVMQTSSLGTGHAIAQVLPCLADDARVLIMPGDTPLMSAATLEAFMHETDSQAVGMMTAQVENPHGLGRVMRNEHHQILGVVEEKDADLTQKQCNEVNVGIYVVPVRLLQQWIPQLSNHNAQEEYYLTDIIAMAVQESIPVSAFCVTNANETQGVNTIEELAKVEKTYHHIQARGLLAKGLHLKDPQHFWLYGTLQFGQDVTISHNVTLEGDVQIGNNVQIGPYSILNNVTIASDVIIESHCVIKNAVIQSGARVGPFAHVHDQVQLMEKSVVGNFVEVTRSHIGKNSKIKHLSYMGDVIMGEKVNIGAGTITCNYDGLNKHQTQIEDECHIGAHTAIIAPTTIGYKATIGAGSVVTKDAPANQLTLSRSAQTTLKHWKRPKDRQAFESQEEFKALP